MNTTVAPRKHTSLWLIACMILAAAITRVLPHPPNFTPLGAMALFAGATYRDRRLALLVPLAALLLSDYLIGQVMGTGFGFYSSQIFVYAAFVMITLLGRVLTNHRRSPLRIVGMSLAVSTLFFVVTNLGVWIASGMYPRTVAGFSQCFVQAIPFFGNTVAGDLVYVTVLFGGLAFVESLTTETENVTSVNEEA
ncbi:MAG: hypothetical protein KDA93_08160 [Planctomycetaceae bacterium]|nr:hypothetical protein [Planctomycetaceae bacterium]